MRNRVIVSLTLDKKLLLKLKKCAKENGLTVSSLVNLILLNKESGIWPKK